jgi:hypothetical protein
MEDTATMRDLGQAVGSLGLSAGINFSYPQIKR